MLKPITMPVRIPSPKCGQDYTNPENNAPTTKEKAFQGFEKVKQERYNDIYSHEQAHKSAGGAQAGSIFIETDGNGVAVGGHVPIRMPSGVDKLNPEKSHKEAEVAYQAALAPGDPSSADLAIASSAQSIMGMARATTGNQSSGFNTSGQDNKGPGKKLNFIA